jgi:hypothetical protein
MFVKFYTHNAVHADTSNKWYTFVQELTKCTHKLVTKKKNYMLKVHCVREIFCLVTACYPPILVTSSSDKVPVNDQSWIRDQMCQYHTLIYTKVSEVMPSFYTSRLKPCTQFLPLHCVTRLSDPYWFQHTKNLIMIHEEQILRLTARNIHTLYYLCVNIGIPRRIWQRRAVCVKAKIPPSNVWICRTSWFAWTWKEVYFWRPGP